ncbi:aspartate/glutamate racemase family protein [Alicyclobacillus sp. SO9]|uniref:aspartate/glutamate racemase family protein n=1 Tax=Alicyclobacillus sp. SO9 TaxID=2665646 RepID=UPI0018E882F1|nr:aspartate/glutamate racemase family protein [Alicyclobacillus sp. SO9]QQE77068.1 aspartate/glutamate racemase family protein [Alicyclobacillus sp. SO9]
MKTIGMIGGTSWESTSHYYSELNEGVKARLGGLHSAKLLLWSVDFAEIEELQSQGDWARAAEIFVDIARRLEAAGADSILIAANTMHIVAQAVAKAVSIPVLHIGDATAKAVHASNIKKVLLLGTRYTLEHPFLRNHLEQLGLEIVIPASEDILTVNDVIYEELCLGVVTEPSREKLLSIILRNENKGIEGVILGCTELAMILEQQHVNLPIFDTTSIHVQYALDASLSSEGS